MGIRQLAAVLLIQVENNMVEYTLIRNTSNQFEDL